MSMMPKNASVAITVTMLCVGCAASITDRVAEYPEDKNLMLDRDLVWDVLESGVDILPALFEKMEHQMPPAQLGTARLALEVVLRDIGSTDGVWLGVESEPDPSRLLEWWSGTRKDVIAGHAYPPPPGWLSSRSTRHKRYRQNWKKG